MITLGREGIPSLKVRRMERHAFSSQSFVPRGKTPFLIVVAPHAPGEGPDARRARAFLAAGGVGVTYVADVCVWHHPLTALAAPARFVIGTWRDGGPHDAEIVDGDPLRRARLRGQRPGGCGLTCSGVRPPLRTR